MLQELQNIHDLCLWLDDLKVPILGFHVSPKHHDCVAPLLPVINSGAQTTRELSSNQIQRRAATFTPDESMERSSTNIISTCLLL